MKCLGAIAALSLVGLIIAVAFGWGTEAAPEEDRRTEQFSKTIAEGVSVQRPGFYGVDFVKCGSCRVEKRKLGLFTLGGFNVLSLHDLSVVIPPGGAGAWCEKSANALRSDAGATTAREILAGMGISDEYMQTRGAALRFSGLKVVNLEVATLLGKTNVCPRFSAAYGVARRDGLHLKDCVVLENGVSNKVGDAVLRVKPEICLYWHTGRQRL